MGKMQSPCGVPLGINVESVSGYRDEIDATHNLFRSLQSIMLNHQGTPWVVRWHALEVSERRRQLSLPRPGSAGTADLGVPVHARVLPRLRDASIVPVQRAVVVPQRTVLAVLHDRVVRRRGVDA